MILNEEESKQAAFDRYVDEEGQEISVGKKILFSNKDIEQIGINKDEYGRPLAVISFTEAGKKAYLELTRKNVKRRLAEIVDGRLLATSQINGAVDTGLVAIPVAATDDAEALIKSLGFTPYLQREIDNDKNAEISYAYARYAMEKGKEKIARKISLQLYKYNPNSDFFKKLIKEYPSLNIDAAGKYKLGQDCCSGHNGTCGDKCCDGTSILAACEELYSDTNYFARIAPSKRELTAVEPDNSVIRKTEFRPTVLTGQSAPKRVITGPEESKGSAAWPASPPRRKVKPISSSK